MLKPPKRINKKTGKLWTAKDWTKYAREYAREYHKAHQDTTKRSLPARDASYEGEYEQFPLTAGDNRWDNNLGDGCRRILPHRSFYS